MFKKEKVDGRPMDDRAIEAVIDAADNVLDALVERHFCGWFDGGCYTLAKAIAEHFPTAEAYHVSRTEQHRDHAVIYIPELKSYLDADGLQTKAQLISKMKEVELVDVSVCLPFVDIDKYPVFADIKELLAKELISCS